MIIARGSGLENIKANFFVIITGGDIQIFKNYIIHPEKLISSIRISDEKVNQILHYYANQKTFHSLFFIKPCNFSSKEEISQELSAYFDAVNKRHVLIQKIIEKQKHTVSRNKEAATVLVKISDDKIVIDHEIVVTKDSSYSRYSGGHIYVLGDWTNIHSRKVAGKIITAVKDGFADWKLNNDDPVVIHLEEAVVDHTTAATLAQIIFNEMRTFTDIKIICNEKNYRILESADGFSLIKKIVFFQKD